MILVCVVCTSVCFIDDETGDVITIKVGPYSLIEDPLKEIAIMQSYAPQNPANVVPLLAAWHNRNCLFAIMPYYTGGDLIDILNSNKMFEEPIVKVLFKQMLFGLEQLHEMGNSCVTLYSYDSLLQPVAFY